MHPARVQRTRQAGPAIIGRRATSLLTRETLAQGDRDGLGHSLPGQSDEATGRSVRLVGFDAQRHCSVHLDTMSRSSRCQSISPRHRSDVQACLASRCRPYVLAMFSRPAPSPRQFTTEVAVSEDCPPRRDLRRCQIVGRTPCNVSQAPSAMATHAATPTRRLAAAPAPGQAAPAAPPPCPTAAAACTAGAAPARERRKASPAWPPSAPNTAPTTPRPAPSTLVAAPCWFAQTC